MGESQNLPKFTALFRLGNILLFLEEGKKIKNQYILGLFVTHEIWVLLHDFIESTVQ